MRRTDLLPRAARRRIAGSSFALLLATAPTPAPAAEDAVAVAVARSFATYKSALERGDGALAASAVSSNSLAYYDRMRKLALTAPRSELEALEGTERMLVLALRHQAPFPLLRSGTPEDLVAYAVNESLVSDTGIVETDLGEVTVRGDRARGWIIVDGTPTRGVLEFAREDGRWKFDLEFAMRSSAGWVAALARESGMTEDDVIFELLTRGSSKPVGPDIWQPPSAD